MKKFCLLTLLCPLLSLAQTGPLTVGDSLPPGVIARIPIGGAQAAPDAITILDFWASWCGSCSKGIAKLDTLAGVFGNQLDVVLVNSHHTGDDRDKVEKYKSFYIGRYGRRVPFPILLADSIFLELFPHKYIPHYVWLQHGRVRAITSWREVNRENIEAVLRDPTFQLRNVAAESTGSAH